MNESDWTEESRTDRPWVPPVIRVPDVAGTLAERELRYGLFENQALIAQRIKDCFRKEPSGWHRLAWDQKEALDMVASKIARILNGDPDYHDSWHDIQGYVKLVADSLIKEEMK